MVKLFFLIQVVTINTDGVFLVEDIQGIVTLSLLELIGRSHGDHRFGGRVAEGWIQSRHFFSQSGGIFFLEGRIGEIKVILDIFFHRVLSVSEPIQQNSQEQVEQDIVADKNPQQEIDHGNDEGLFGDVGDVH
jgi:hypothetical protein